MRCFMQGMLRCDAVAFARGCAEGAAAIPAARRRSFPTCRRGLDSGAKDCWLDRPQRQCLAPTAQDTDRHKPHNILSILLDPLAGPTTYHPFLPSHGVTPLAGDVTRRRSNRLVLLHPRGPRQGPGSPPTCRRRPGDDDDGGTRVEPHTKPRSPGVNGSNGADLTW